MMAHPHGATIIDVDGMGLGRTMWSLRPHLPQQVMVIAVVVARSQMIFVTKMFAPILDHGGISVLNILTLTGMRMTGRPMRGQRGNGDP